MDLSLQPSNQTENITENASLLHSEVPLLSILYLDDFLAVVDKPAGMLVHRSFLDKHETLFVMQTLRNQLGRHVFPVHRLDRPTSGVLVFALSSDIARLLTEQHQEESWQKFYLAIVRGYVKAPLLLDYPLFEQLDKIADKQANQHKAAQDARTAIWPIAQVELPVPVGRYPAARYSLVALQPLTGRKHQLRRHLAHLRHPIVGDTSHGDGKHNQLFAKHLSAQRLMLVAKRLQLKHPVTGELLLFDAGLQELKPLFTEFGWQATDDYFAQLWSTLDYQQLPVQCDPAKQGK
jgi:tRNA pseudouridine65 synthase